MRLPLHALTRLLAKLALLFFIFSPGGQAEQDEAQAYQGRFDTAWRLVAERYWDLDVAGVDWQEVRVRYEPRLAGVDADGDFYALLSEMYEELGDNHSVFVPPERVDTIRQDYGDLPCVGVFAATTLSDAVLADNLTDSGNVGYRLLEDGVGYLRLPDLVVTGAAQHLRTAVRRLAAERAKGLILDLRGNPGGRLLEMMQAAGIFTRGFLWRVVTRWTLPVPYPALGSVETDLPLVVLIDAQVNSAAEGLAGALQTSGRATMIGETTAGNVEAVLPFCLRDGSQAWIATGVLAPLLGATWEGRGVIPDIEAGGEAALEAAVRFFDGR
ncbi:MAG: S41 family peptidase [Deinococcota bacterium]|nr:S41 family peptidase [Deinococcota bacterium]